MVKATGQMLGLLSNAEVLQVLIDRGAAGNQPGSRALASERLVYHYLSTRSVGPVERATLEQCMAQLKPFNLSRAEVLNLINLCPSSPVEVFLVVDNCDQRLTDEQIEQIIEIVALNLKH